jgi:hypothetical protein
MNSIDTTGQTLATRDQIISVLDDWQTATHRYLTAANGDAHVAAAAELAGIRNILHSLRDNATGIRGTVATSMQLHQLRENWHAATTATHLPVVGDSRSRTAHLDSFLNSGRNTVQILQFPDGDLTLRWIFAIGDDNAVERIIRLRRHWPLLLRHPAVQQRVNTYGWHWDRYYYAYVPSADWDLLTNIGEEELDSLYQQLDTAATELDQIPHAHLANRLAADDPNLTHTWESLLNTAAALIP